MKNLKTMLVKSKNRKTAEETSRLMHTIADKIAEKKIKFAQGMQESEVVLPDHLIFTISATEKKLKRKGLTRRINLQVKWYEGNDTGTPIEIS